MTRFALAAFVLLTAAPDALAIDPEACLVQPGARAAVTVEHEGRSWELAAPECRELFLSDPERYAQLFEALAELGARSSRPSGSGTVSLVPN
ncbi:MAG TPA: hypothetical protein VMS56_15150 [Thermoanaerobaculia bacterium]|nr:hypothetical protein [Thermoanaerobaculia bacterium]